MSQYGGFTYATQAENDAAATRTEKRKQIIKAARYGKYYCPATDHFSNATVVNCDDCGRTDLIDSFGFDGERIDVCLDCTRKIRLHLAKLLSGKVDGVTDPANASSTSGDASDVSEVDEIDYYEEPADEVEEPVVVKPTIPSGAMLVPRTKMRQSMFKPTLKVEAPYGGGVIKIENKSDDSEEDSSETEEPKPVKPVALVVSVSKKRKSQEPSTSSAPTVAKSADVVHTADGGKWESLEFLAKQKKKKGKSTVITVADVQKHATRMRQSMMGGGGRQ